MDVLNANQNVVRIANFVITNWIVYNVKSILKLKIIYVFLFVEMEQWQKDLNNVMTEITFNMMVVMNVNFPAKMNVKFAIKINVQIITRLFYVKQDII